MASLANEPVVGADTEEVPVHILDGYDCSDGGVVNPVGVLDSSLDTDEVETSRQTNAAAVAGEIEAESAETDEVQTHSVGHPESGVAASSTPVVSCLPCWSGFLRGLRALWSTRQMEETRDNRELHIRITLRELIVYVIFLVDLCIVTFGMINSMSYYFSDAIIHKFVEERADVYNPLSTYKDIDCIDDWYNYVTGPFLRGLYGEKLEQSALDLSDEVIVLAENQLIGVPRLRTLRVRSDSCNVHLDFREFVKVCYDVYSPASEDRLPYGPSNSSAWIYQTAVELGGCSQRGRLAVYDGGGYTVDLIGNNTSAMQQLTELRNGGWLDRGTRVVFIDFSLYNPNVNLFCIVSLLCEFPATGGAVTSWNIRTLKLLRYVTTFDYCILACECLFVLFILYFIVEEVLELKHVGWSYLTGLLNILDIVIIAASICTISFSIHQAAISSRSLNSFERQDDYVNLASVSYWQTVRDSTLAVTLFLAWIKLFKYISFNQTMMQLTTTMSVCAKDLAGFTIMFLVVFLSFAQLAFLVFGSQLESYSSFSVALYSQFRILLGDFKFSELENADHVLGPMYFILYVFFVFFILLSMFIAIINDAYSEVKADSSRQKHEFEMIDFFKKSCHNVLAKLRLRHDKSQAAGSSLVSESASSHAHDYKHWRSDRLREGYTEAQIAAVASRYDSSRSSQAVGRLELRKMQADLSRLKFADRDGDSDSLDLSDDDDDVSTSTKSEVRGGGTTRRSGATAGRGNRGVTHEEFTMLQRRVDRMEHSIGSIVSKIDAVLVKLEAMEQTKARRRETVGRLLDSIAESEGVTDESKRQHMERLVRDELERWDSESCISSHYDHSPPSSTSGRAAVTSPPSSDHSQDVFSGSSA